MKKVLVKLIIATFFAALVLVSFGYAGDNVKVFADDVARVEVGMCPDGEPGPCTRSWAEYLVDIFKTLSKVGSVLVVLMLTYAGYILMTSQGDSSKISTAKEIALGSILGLIILILVPLLINFLGLSTKVN